MSDTLETRQYINKKWWRLNYHTRTYIYIFWYLLLICSVLASLAFFFLKDYALLSVIIFTAVDHRARNINIDDEQQLGISLRCYTARTIRTRCTDQNMMMMANNAAAAADDNASDFRWRCPKALLYPNCSWLLQKRHHWSYCCCCWSIGCCSGKTLDNWSYLAASSALPHHVHYQCLFLPLGLVDFSYNIRVLVCYCLISVFVKITMGVCVWCENKICV